MKPAWPGRVVLEILPVGGTKGGIYVNKNEKKPHVKGIVALVGHGVREDIQVDDWVIFSRYSGLPFDFADDDKEYLIFNEKDIWVRVEPPTCPHGVDLKLECPDCTHGDENA